MIEVLVKVLASYLLGGVMGGDVMRAIFGGADLRGQGSGNVGATNALRTRGAKYAIGVLLIDVLKGVIATLLIPAFAWPFGDGDAYLLSELPFLCGLAAALGHCYPPFHKFRGGKGVATLTGVFGALLPAALPGMIAAFAVALMVSGYVSLASILGAFAALLYVAFFHEIISATGLFTLAMVALLVYKHRENIVRLYNGTESRFEKARVIGKLFDRVA
jgi:glycerol-3-phosphate acyltransferase PlsY